jgi:hypothetical protein
VSPWTATGRIQNSEFAEGWNNWDALELMQQIGVGPGPGEPKVQDAQNYCFGTVTAGRDPDQLFFAAQPRSR